MAQCAANTHIADSLENNTTLKSTSGYNQSDIRASADMKSEVLRD